jgi:hypothetical protein
MLSGRSDGCEMRPTCQELQEDQAAGLVHGGGDEAPAVDLFAAVNAVCNLGSLSSIG